MKRKSKSVAQKWLDNMEETGRTILHNKHGIYHPKKR